jgi:hypothetical protein
MLITRRQALCSSTFALGGPCWRRNSQRRRPLRPSPPLRPIQRKNS